MTKKIYFAVMTLCLQFSAVQAQKTCVIANAEDHLPLREALIHTDNNHWARTDYRGYWTMKYAFDSATVSKHGFLKTTIRYKELPDTVFLLPQRLQINEVTVWGKDQEHVDEMEQLIKKKIKQEPRPITGIGFNALGWLDKRGNRDRKHLKKAKGILQKMDRKDPIIAAYEQAMGKKSIAATEDSVSAADCRSKTEPFSLSDSLRQSGSAPKTECWESSPTTVLSPADNHGAPASPLQAVPETSTKTLPNVVQKQEE